MGLSKGNLYFLVERKSLRQQGNVLLQVVVTCLCSNKKSHYERRYNAGPFENRYEEVGGVSRQSPIAFAERAVFF